MSLRSECVHLHRRQSAIEIPASVLLAIPAIRPAFDQIEQTLARAGIGVESIEATGDEITSTRWEAWVTARLVDETKRAFRIWLEPSPRAQLAQVLLEPLHPRGLSDVELEDARTSAWTLGIATQFRERPLWDFHAQLKMLHALCADTVCVFDASSLMARSGGWLEDVALSIAPPSPTALYTTHAVANPQGPLWLHTHGLARCGSIELDLLDVPNDLGPVARHVLDAVAGMFIERGIVEPDEPFAVGRDLDFVWLPWREGIRKARRGIPGGKRDRHDAAHTGSRGILFAPEPGLSGRRRYASIASYRDILEHNPLVYLSEMATARAALLARERLPRFRALFERFGGGDDWSFLVKLGCPVDRASCDGDREHMWFEVHALADGTVEATLRNQPYAIASMRPGDRGSHELAMLSDWIILCDQGDFGPDTVGELERRLEHPASDARGRST